jgi:hypothetical protein
MKFLHHPIWVLLLLTAGLITGCQSAAPPAPTATEPPTATYTALPPTETPVPPTATFTEVPDTATPTVTLSPTPTLEPTETATSTEEPPLATIYAYSVCRHGPGTVYTIHTYFKEDSTALVRGRLEDDSWLLVELPEAGETCWIFNEIVDLSKTIAMMPVATPPPKPTPAPVPTKTDEQKALGEKYFLIIPDNGGPFACGDGLAYFYSGKKGKGAEEEITVALNALFAVKSQYVGNYYNPIYQSSLRVKDVEVGPNGNVTIWLGGNFVKPKNECEAKRMHLVVWETARQFPEVKKRPVIWVNNVLLGDLLRAIQDNK